MDDQHANGNDELTVPEAADYVHLMITRVMELCEAGTFGRPIATPNGTDWLIRRADLDAYAERLLAQYHARQHAFPFDTDAARENR